MARWVWPAVFLVASSILTPFAWGETVASGDKETIVILVRHAEKVAPWPDNNPPLTPDGQRRAEVLAAVLKDAKLSAIITTQLHRTVDTAQPSAKAAGINPDPPVNIDPSKIPQHVAAVAAAVRNHLGGTVLVVGHDITIPDVIAALGGPQPAPIGQEEYDRLFVLILGKEVHLVQSRYGTPSPSTASGN
jgi:broad specificity phosphatase PhoE